MSFGLSCAPFGKDQGTFCLLFQYFRKVHRIHVNERYIVPEELQQASKESFGDDLGAHWGVQWRSWGSLGALQASPGALPGGPWGVLRSLGCRLWSPKGNLVVSWELFWPSPECLLGSPVRRLRALRVRARPVLNAICNTFVGSTDFTSMKDTSFQRGFWEAPESLLGIICEALELSLIHI